MLKKLLASALAVATVASCAYVPSALTSAATDYKTATAVDYLDWELKNPAAPSTQVTAKIFVSSNDATYNGETYELKVDAENNTEEYVKSKIADAIRTGTTDEKLPEIKPTSTDKTRYVLSSFASATNGIYVAQVTKETAVVYSEWDVDFNASKVDNASTDELNKKHAKLLGYYSDATAAGVIADMYTAGLTGKLAGSDFVRWVNNNDGSVKPEMTAISSADSRYYTEVTLYWLSAIGDQNAAVAKAAESGLYYNSTAANTGSDTFVLPNNDSANWTTYLTNWLYYKTANDGWDFNGVTINSVGYDVNTIRKVADKTYAVTYVKDGVDDAEPVTYTLTLTLTDGTTVIGNWTKDENVKGYYYTTDINEMYTIVKGSDDKATLAEYLVKDKDDGKYYTLTGKYYKTSVDTTAHQVVYNVQVEKWEKYTVYSFGANDTVKKSEAFVSASMLEKTYYATLDGNDQFINNDTSIRKMTAADLGVAADATIDGVPAVFAYVAADDVDEVNKVIETTYKLGDATVTLPDFATTTGAFNDVAYFGKAAKAGDIVTLKVSFSDQGDAKKFDLKNVTVDYTVIGATEGETFTYSVRYPDALDTYKDGVATEFVLAEGTNIVTATVSYNGKVVGTFAPFYAYVG